MLIWYATVMPSANSIKQFAPDQFYHVYNRGVEKRKIFEDAQDYQKFLHYLKTYLSPVDILRQENPLLRSNLVNNNLADEVDLIAFCLMPNHFHMLVHQKTRDGMTKLLKQVSVGYSMYFNKRYSRVGPLFQGIYKACTVENEDYLLHLSRYIHLNPLERGVSLEEFQWSSYLDYLGKRQTAWVKPSSVLSYFNAQNPNFSYQNFVEKYVEEDLSKISKLTLEVQA